MWIVGCSDSSSGCSGLKDGDAVLKDASRLLEQALPGITVVIRACYGPQKACKPEEESKIVSKGESEMSGRVEGLRAI